MRANISVLLVLVVLFSGFCGALGTRDIDAVRKKDILENSDTQVISDFASEAVAELIFIDKASEIGDVRGTIVARSKSTNERYGKLFDEAIGRAISDGFGEAAGLDDEKLAERGKLNLLLLISELGSLKVADEAMEYVGSDDAAVRYLAIKSLTNEKIVAEIKDGGADGVAKSKEILGVLIDSVEGENQSSIILEMAQFAASINNGQAKELLLGIADKRIAMYRGWRVVDGDVDGRILEIIGKKAVESMSNNDRAELGQRFGQLYSFVIQRYIKTYKTAGEDELGDMVTVMVAVENGVLGEMMGATSSSIRNAIQKKDLVSLRSSHDLILGSAESKGALSEAMNFSYGEGENSTDEPEKLGEMPEDR